MPSIRVVNDDARPLPANLQHAVDYLQHGSNGPTFRDGVLDDRRIVYFKGQSALKALLHPTFSTATDGKNATSIAADDATDLLTKLMHHGVFLSLNQQPNASSSNAFKLEANQPLLFDPKGRYVWLYESQRAKWGMWAASALLLVAGIILAMFPLWPYSLQRTLPLVPAAVIVAYFVASGLRWVVEKATGRCLKNPLVLFPRLHDDLDPIRSFWPIWGWHDPEKAAKEKEKRKKKKKSRNPDERDWARESVPANLQFDRVIDP